MALKSSALFRRPGDRPPAEYTAAGVFALGYPAELLEPSAGALPDCDLAIVHGGPNRYGGNNRRIVEYYRATKTPVLMIEFGPDDEHVLIFKSGNKTALPSETLEGYERAARLGMRYAPTPRGSKIIVVGQGPEYDRKLEPWVEKISDDSVRPIIYRPHPNMPTEGPRGCDAVDLEADLDDAFAVVTHSSGMGRDALLRGIPVFAHEAAQYRAAAHRLQSLRQIEDLEPAGPAAVNQFFARFAFVQWSIEELKTGEAICRVLRS